MFWTSWAASYSRYWSEQTRFLTFDIQPGRTTLPFTSDVIGGAHVRSDVVLRYILDDEVPGFMDADTTVRMDGATVFLPSGKDNG